MFMPGFFNDSLFDDFFEDVFGTDRASKALKPMQRVGFPVNGLMKTDVKETEKAFELAMELPGYAKENVKAELKKGYLIVHANNEVKDEEKTTDGKYICRERYYGSCNRSFYVGKEVTEEDIQAKFDNGVLKITVAKKEPKPEIEEKRFISIDG